MTMFVTSAFAQETAPAVEAGKEGDAHGATEVPGAAEHANFPPFDPHTFPSQILWLVICFGLFYMFLKRVVIPRIGNILNVRSNRIAQDLAQAEKLKNEADAAVAAYEQELAEARAKANAIGQAASNAAKAEAETKRKQVEAELAGKLAKAEARIAKIKSSALADVSTIAADTATAIVERLIGGKVDKAAVDAAVKAVQE
jgi:F-type H+-transporting ATPase subunit b